MLLNTYYRPAQYREPQSPSMTPRDKHGEQTLAFLQKPSADSRIHKGDPVPCLKVWANETQCRRRFSQKMKNFPCGHIWHSAFCISSFTINYAQNEHEKKNLEKYFTDLYVCACAAYLKPHALSQLQIYFSKCADNVEVRWLLSQLTCHLFTIYICTQLFIIYIICMHPLVYHIHHMSVPICLPYTSVPTCLSYTPYACTHLFIVYFVCLYDSVVNLHCHLFIIYNMHLCNSEYHFNFCWEISRCAQCLSESSPPFAYKLQMIFVSVPS